MSETGLAKLEGMPQTFAEAAIWLAQRGIETELRTDLNPFSAINSRANVTFAPEFRIRLTGEYRPEPYSPHVISVEVEGIGETPDAALQNAFIRAKNGVAEVQFHYDLYPPFRRY